jgi:hypothetical protein
MKLALKLPDAKTPYASDASTGAGWFYKALTIGLAPVILERVFPGHAHMSFALGSLGGVILQHFLPPQGRPRHLLILLALALGCSILYWWLF